MTKKYGGMKKEMTLAKNAKAKFNGNDFDPLNQLRSNLQHLNYQVADHKARYENLIAGENRMLNSEIERIKNEEERQQWR